MINEEMPKSNKEVKKQIEELTAELVKLRKQRLEQVLAQKPYIPVLTLRCEKIPKKGEK